jgi:hypothetical protein
MPSREACRYQWTPSRALVKLTLQQQRKEETAMLQLIVAIVECMPLIAPFFATVVLEAYIERFSN